MINWEKLSEDVRVARARRQINQGEAASEMGLAHSTVCRLEAGKTVNADGFMAVCKWLDCKAEETLT